MEQKCPDRTAAARPRGFPTQTHPLCAHLCVSTTPLSPAPILLRPTVCKAWGAPDRNESAPCQEHHCGVLQAVSLGARLEICDQRAGSCRRKEMPRVPVRRPSQRQPALSPGLRALSSASSRQILNTQRCPREPILPLTQKPRRKAFSSMFPLVQHFSACGS